MSGRSLPRRPLAEPAPGSLFGFHYSRSRNEQTGVLRVLRLMGNGRDLLLRFPLYQHLDGLTGPNVILTSGSNWAPDSARFHLQQPVDGILRPRANRRVPPSRLMISR